MDKPSQPQVLILGDVPKPRLWERALSAIGLIGGGALGTYYGAKIYGNQAGSLAGADIFEPSAKEIEHAVETAPHNVAASVNAELERLVPGLKVNATVEGGTRRQKEFATAEAAATSAEAKAPHGKIISARTARRLRDLAASDPTESISGITYARDAQGQLSAKLHLDVGGDIHLPHIDDNPYSIAAKNLSAGTSIKVKSQQDIAMLGAAHGPIDSALTKRRVAISEELPGSMKAAWGSLKRLDSNGKINVVSMAIMGVVFGGFIADIAKTVVNSVSHLGTVSSARGEGVKPR